MGSLELFRMRSIVNVLFTFPYFIYKLSTPNNSCPTINTMLTSKPRYVKSGDSKIWLANPPLRRCAPFLNALITLQITDPVGCVPPLNAPITLQIADPVGCVPFLNAPITLQIADPVDTVLIVKGYYHVWVLKRGSNGLPDFRTPYAKCSNFFMAATMISILTWWLASIRLFRSMTIGL